jgi:ABC-type multidrug transport system fused ATPase/permease subunit
VTGSGLDEVAFGPENLRLPVVEVLARAEAALRRVGLWDRRGENPERLSGGGRQRLAIACALAMGSDLLVLDEPTANLDVRAEASLFEDFLDLTRGLTTILISHRFSTVRHADRIVVLDGGRVVEDGSHDELLAAGGHYAGMFQLQAARFRD